jgi:hypothetical protein
MNTFLNILALIFKYIVHKNRFLISYSNLELSLIRFFKRSLIGHLDELHEKKDVYLEIPVIYYKNLTDKLFLSRDFSQLSYIT